MWLLSLKHEVFRLHLCCIMRHSFIPSYGYTSLEVGTGVFNFYFLATQLVRSLSSLTRDQTLAPAVEMYSPNRQTAREFPWVYQVFNLVH